MLNHYYTIEKDGNFELEIKKSRFICHLKQVKNEIEAQDFIQSIKKEHGKANHNCVAYLIGEHDEIQRAYDDGEPSGTAGVPMLEVLKKTIKKRCGSCYTLFWRHKTGSRWINTCLWKGRQSRTERNWSGRKKITHSNDNSCLLSSLWKIRKLTS